MNQQEADVVQQSRDIRVGRNRRSRTRGTQGGTPRPRPRSDSTNRLCERSRSPSALSNIRDRYTVIARLRNSRKPNSRAADRQVLHVLVEMIVRGIDAAQEQGHERRVGLNQFLQIFQAATGRGWPAARSPGRWPRTPTRRSCGTTDAATPGHRDPAVAGGLLVLRTEVFMRGLWLATTARDCV